MKNDKILDYPEEPVVLRKRPAAITVICIFGLIGVLAIAHTLFSGEGWHIGVWYPPYMAFCGFTSLICMIGLWKMKKWAVIVYAALVAISQSILFIMGLWSIKSLVIPAIVVAVALFYMNRMD